MLYVRPIKGAVTRAVNLVESLSVPPSQLQQQQQILEPLASKSILTFFPVFFVHHRLAFSHLQYFFYPGLNVKLW